MSHQRQAAERPKDGFASLVRVIHAPLPRHGRDQPKPRHHRSANLQAGVLSRERGRGVHLRPRGSNGVIRWLLGRLNRQKKRCRRRQKRDALRQK